MSKFRDSNRIDSSIKLQKLLDSDSRGKINQQVQQISKKTDVDYCRPKCLILKPVYLNDYNTTSFYAMVMSAKILVNSLLNLFDDVAKSENKEQWEYAMKK